MENVYSFFSFLKVQRFRGRFVDEVTSSLKQCNEGKRFIPANLPESVHIVENFATEITNHPNSGDDRVKIIFLKNFIKIFASKPNNKRSCRISRNFSPKPPLLQKGCL